MQNGTCKAANSIQFACVRIVLEPTLPRSHPFLLPTMFRTAAALASNPESQQVP